MNAQDTVGSFACTEQAMGRELLLGAWDMQSIASPDEHVPTRMQQEGTYCLRGLCEEAGLKLSKALLGDCYGCQGELDRGVEVGSWKRICAAGMTDDAPSPAHPATLICARCGGMWASEVPSHMLLQEKAIIWIFRGIFCY